MKAVPEAKVKRQVPNVERANKGMTLKRLMRNTPPYYRNHAQDVVVKQLNAQAMTKGGLPAITARCKSMDRKGAPAHRCSIISLDKPEGKVARSRLKVNKATKVLVACDCEDFCFTWEYALWTWGAAKIKYSNGDPAVMKNPGNIPGLCKHLFAVAKTIVEHNL